VGTLTYAANGNEATDTTGSGNTYTYEKRNCYHALSVGGTATVKESNRLKPHHVSLPGPPLGLYNLRHRRKPPSDVPNW
jgi:hypothetical protein